MEGSNALAVIDQPGVTIVTAAPREMYRVATDVAGVCGDIVQKTAKQIQRKKYVCIEGWQAIATAHGCALSVESVEEDADGNVTSVASVRRMSDGGMIAKAEGFVGMDEATWRGRARYARRAMAQTRAMSRAARSAFAHVVVLIDAGLSTTPAEEVPMEGFDDNHDDRQQPSEPVRTDPLADDKVFREHVGKAFKARGFTQEQMRAAMPPILKAFNVDKPESLTTQQRHALLRGIADGTADKFKNPNEGKAA